jgi:uncharacterized protein (DUF58 family)
MLSVASLRERFALWALRTRPPEASPVVLTQRRIYVLPTGGGLFFAASLLVMLLGAINYNLSLGHALVFLLAGLGLIGILHTFRNLVGLRISPARVEPVFAGETAHFMLQFENPLAYERRLLEISLPGGAEDRIDILPNAVTIARLGLPTRQRGWLELPRLSIQTTYPLGLIRAWSYAAPAQRCLVFPRPANRSLPKPASADQGTGQIHGNRGHEDFFGLRAHLAADSPRHVAWKQAARQSDLMPLQTKQFSGGMTQTLWFDWNELPPGLGVEEALSMLTRWLLDAEADGLDWGLRMPGKTPLAPDRGQEHLRAGLTLLALYENA